MTIAFCQKQTLKNMEVIVSDEEEYIATLVHPDEYQKHSGQVAKLTTHRITYIKGRALRAPELVDIPMAEVEAVSYKVIWAILPMIFGAFLVGVIAFIFSSDVEVGTRVPIGALSLALIFGFFLVRGPKRHRFTFLVHNKKLHWQSRAGDFKYKVASVQKIVSFAHERGILSA